jgi:hypothetical protein
VIIIDTKTTIEANLKNTVDTIGINSAGQVSMVLNEGQDLARLLSIRPVIVDFLIKRATDRL